MKYRMCGKKGAVGSTIDDLKPFFEVNV